MLFERIESAGLAHYSYLIGDEGQAVVIDPRRDCDVYLERTQAQEMRITHILETHRNEDYVIGSRELAARTDATILHSAHSRPAVAYAEPIRDGERLQVGRLTIEALHTPGHTLGHMSYLLRDPQGLPWIVFTGDALFAGEVGRVDLAGAEHTREMAGMLYESLFRRLLPLGDEVIVCPAHGAGSVCGTAIGERAWTTIGLERKHNPRLQHTAKPDFVDDVAHALEYPPYFRMMEKLNLEGPPVLGALPSPAPLSAREFAAEMAHAQVLDTRPQPGFAPAHVPGALWMWAGGMPRFAGWFLSYERPLLLLSETALLPQVVRSLIRMGFDALAGVLAEGMLGWHKAGLDSESTRTITVQGLCSLLDNGEETWILDVRSAHEWDEERIPGAHHIHITQLPERFAEVPRDRRVFIFCGSGLRSMIAAGFLQQQGWHNLTVVLGGMAGWRSARYPLEH